MMRKHRNIVAAIAMMTLGGVAAAVATAQTAGIPPSTSPTADAARFLHSPTAFVASPGAVTTATPGTVEQIVEITQSLPADAAAVTAFTVPAGRRLIVTDVLLTNTGAAARCGFSIHRNNTVTANGTSANGTTVNGTTVNGTTTNGTTAGAIPSGLLTRSDSTLTGPLCVPAQQTLDLSLMTGLEFGAGQIVQLLAGPEATGPPAGEGVIGVHLRGFLVFAGP